MSTAILRSEQDGIEFFTIEATGESGMSQTSLSLLAGVSHQAVSKLENSLATKSPSESLEPWADKVKTLATDSEYKNATIYCSGFCSAVIQHYAFKGNKVAQYSLTKFSTSGIDSWIQQQTGWQSKAIDPSSLDRALLIDLLKRVTQIESQTLRTLSPAVPEISKHNLARKLVNEQAARTKLQHQFVWREAYAELDYLFGYDISKKTCKGSKLQKIEDDEQLDNLIAIMEKIWIPTTQLNHAH